MRCSSRVLNVDRIVLWWWRQLRNQKFIACRGRLKFFLQRVTRRIQMASFSVLHTIYRVGATVQSLTEK